MKPGRNDPCPCGSGRKYKHCCAERDARSAPVLRLLGASTAADVFSIASRSVTEPVPWEADVTPTSVPVSDDLTARPAAVLVVAQVAGQGLVLYTDFLAHPPSDPAGVALILAHAVRDALAKGAAAPSRLLVRHREVATVLSALLHDLDTEVDVVSVFECLEDLAAGLRQQLGGFSEPAPAVSAPHTWAAWGLPESVIARLFQAAAEFHVARPWVVLENEQLLDLVMPGGRRWTASVLGNGGQQFGLVLYERAEDVLTMYETPSPSDAFRRMQSVVLSLSFDRRTDLPKPMQREIARAGWRVNGPHAYPMLWALNTIGGGISPEQMEDLVLALGASARFAAVHSAQLIDPARRNATIVWNDDVTGVLVRSEGFEDEGDLWSPVVALSPGLPGGMRADPDALYREGDANHDVDSPIIEKFTASERASGAPEARVGRDAQNVELFVDAMHSYQGVTLAAVTEFDLRSFLYDWFPRKVRMSRTQADTMRGSLRRFFEYLAGHEGIVYPWARGILRDKLAFEERWDTFPGGFWWDEDVGEWRVELSEDLHARVMLPMDALADVGTWGETMRVEEARLRTMLQRQWLQWRDEVIAAGVMVPAQARAELARRQAEWERRAQPWLEGESVSEVVRRERAKR